MVGGNEVTISKVDKILNVMGSVKRAGPLGAGHAMKSLNNYVSAAGLIASFEALNTAKKYGIEARNFIEIINGATGKNNTTEVKLEKFVVSEKYNSGWESLYSSGSNCQNFNICSINGMLVLFFSYTL